MKRNLFSISVVVIQPVGYPHFRRSFGILRWREIQLKVWRQHADNLHGQWTIMRELSDHRGTSAIPPLKIFVTKNRDRGQFWRGGGPRLRSAGLRSRLRQSIGVREIAAQRDLRADQVKEIGRRDAQ